ncbi:MAG: histidinol-phosphate transaminase [Chloroflexota bacterium]
MRVRRAVQAMKPYVPGVSVESVQRELSISGVIKLNQNENPLGPSPKAMKAAMASMTEMHTYPEGSSLALRERLAHMWDMPADWFLVGNGSDEIFRLLAESYLEEGDCVVVPHPSFAGYPLVSELMAARVVRVDLRDHAMDLDLMAQAAARENAKLLFLCRPNSPTGGVFSEDALHDVMSLIPGNTIVVIDEAYREFDETPFDSRALCLAYPNIIVTRTFSKIYGMAGFRLGYGIMRPSLLEPLYRARDPFSVNSLAMAAGIAALDDEDHVERSRDVVRQGKRFLYAEFDRLGLTYVPTSGNFILFDAVLPALDVYDALLHRGILIRPCASFGLPTSLRVTIGTAEQNQRFAAALGAVLDVHGDIRHDVSV